jgi:selenocysteine lyase/cysteine desulfurase
MVERDDPLLHWRKEFPILDRTVYMISHSLGAMPDRARERMQEYTDTWADRGIRAWEEGWWEMPVTVGNLVGRIIGAGEGEIVMQQNVSICQWVVNSCFDWRARRNKLITDGLNFPSNNYIYHSLERSGARVVTWVRPTASRCPWKAFSTRSMKRPRWSRFPTWPSAAPTCRTWRRSRAGRTSAARWCAQTCTNPRERAGGRARARTHFATAEA